MYVCFFKCRTASGTFFDGDLLLNQKGLRLISDEDESIVPFSPFSCPFTWNIFVCPVDLKRYVIFFIFCLI